MSFSRIKKLLKSHFKVIKNQNFTTVFCLFDNFVLQIFFLVNDRDGMSNLLLSQEAEFRIQKEGSLSIYI